MLFNYDYFTIKTVLINQVCKITENTFHHILSYRAIIQIDLPHHIF
jgi:hypothetical protein